MAKKKKLQSGAASFLDDPNSLNVMPMIKQPNLQGGKDPNLLDLGPILGMALATSIAANMSTKDKEAKLRDRGIIVPPEGLSDEEKKQLGLDGSPAGGGFTPVAEKDKLPQSTGGPPPEKIDTTIIDPIPEPIDTGGGFTPIPEGERMQILTMGDKKESKVQQLQLKQ